MALTDVEICQKALALLGAEQIQSLDESNDRAQTCSIIYPDVKRSALAETHWNFATNKRELSRFSDSPPSEYDYQYSLPNDMVAGPTKVLDGENSSTPIQSWEIANNRLMTNRKTIYIDYVADVDEQRFPSYFTRFLYHALAAELAVNITDQVNMSQKLEQKAYGSPSDNQQGGLLGKAKLLDSQNQSTQAFDDNPLGDARHNI